MTGKLMKRQRERNDYEASIRAQAPTSTFLQHDPIQELYRKHPEVFIPCSAATALRTSHILSQWRYNTGLRGCMGHSRVCLNRALTLLNGIDLARLAAGGRPDTKSELLPKKHTIA